MVHKMMSRKALESLACYTILTDRLGKLINRRKKLRKSSKKHLKLMMFFKTLRKGLTMISLDLKETMPVEVEWTWENSCVDMLTCSLISSMMTMIFHHLALEEDRGEILHQM